MLCSMNGGSCCTKLADIGVKSTDLLSSDPLLPCICQNSYLLFKLSVKASFLGCTVKLARTKLPANAGDFTCSSQKSSPTRSLYALPAV